MDIEPASKQYLVFFATRHLDFRKPELVAVADALNIPFSYVEDIEVKTVSLENFSLIQIFSETFL